MTLSPSRNSTIFTWASPSSSMTSPASRVGAWVTEVIYCPAASHPVAVTPRSAAVTVSTGFDLAAMIPLKLG